MKIQDERLFTEKPKTRKTTPLPVYFYEMRPTEKGQTCTNCDWPIVGRKALWFVHGMAFAPFCRPECIMQFCGIKKGKMRESKSD